MMSRKNRILTLNRRWVFTASVNRERANSRFKVIIEDIGDCIHLREIVGPEIPEYERSHNQLLRSDSLDRITSMCPLRSMGRRTNREPYLSSSTSSKHMQMSLQVAIHVLFR
jgi:hypothetical protein